MTYHLFAGHLRGMPYYSGGARDYMGSYDSVDKAKDFFDREKMRTGKLVRFGTDISFDWAHIACDIDRVFTIVADIQANHNIPSKWFTLELP